jgi:hypothetical protein
MVGEDALHLGFDSRPAPRLAAIEADDLTVLGETRSEVFTAAPVPSLQELVIQGAQTLLIWHDLTLPQIGKNPASSQPTRISHQGSRPSANLIGINTQSRRRNMSTTYREMAVAPPRTAAPARRIKSIAPRRGATVGGVTGGLLGGGAGVAVAVGSAALVPGVDVGVLLAMGMLFGGFNGGLVGLLSRLDGK